MNGNEVLSPIPETLFVKVVNMAWLTLHTALIFLLYLLPAALPSLGHAERQEPANRVISRPAQPDDKTYFIESINAYQKKEYGKAIWKLNALLKGYPDTPLRALAHYQLSQSYFRTGNLRESSRHLKIISTKYPDFDLKGLLNSKQLELLNNAESPALSELTEKADTDPYVAEESDSSLLNKMEILELEKAPHMPLQNLDEILKEFPNASFNELILLRISQLYLSAGNLTEAVKYFNKLSIESPDFPLNNFFNREQLKLLTRHYPLPAGDIKNFTPRELPISPPVSTNIQKSDNPSVAKSATALSVSEVVVGVDCIEIVVEGRLNGYKSFLQNRPERLVIDIPGAESKIKVKSISVNRYGIEKIRIGFHPKSVRIVLDAGVPRFPSNEILLTEKGIKIVFRESDPKQL